MKNLGKYHGLYVQSDTLLLADIFENFQNMCLYELDPAKTFSAPELAWQAALKKTKSKLDFLIDINMLLMEEKGIRTGICHPINQYWDLQYWDVNNLYGWAMSQGFSKKF